MFKLFTCVKKEFILYVNDKVGLVLMFGMPILLVFIMTIIQDSVFRIVENNRISLLIVNNDKGDLGKKLETELSKSGMFEVSVSKNISAQKINDKISDKEILTAIIIPESFSECIQLKTKNISNLILTDFGISDKKTIKKIDSPNIEFYHDPALQENYCFSVINIIQAHLKGIESSGMIQSIYSEMGAQKPNSELQKNLQQNGISIKRISSTSDKKNEIPSSTQHNVPAWTLFAMFFMVISLGTNIVKEKTSGSFMRMKTMPVSFSLIFISKQILYITIALLQVFVIFGIGKLVFPLIGLPPLIFPDALMPTLVLIFMCSFTAVSYALLVGVLSKTEEQVNGFGAISIIIFAALGGIWVPTFAMPDFFQKISLFSPLHWCIEGFYVLFLKHGNWRELAKPLILLLIISSICQLIVFFKIKFYKNI